VPEPLREDALTLIEYLSVDMGILVAPDAWSAGRLVAIRAAGYEKDKHGDVECIACWLIN
jgi:hypothetical protein